MPSTPPVALIDAFTDVSFGGNPAAVVQLDQAASADWMQAVATEMNQSETAFLHRIDAGWALRWFTPRAEVDLCGHATLAAAHLLWESGAEPDSSCHFLTRSGMLHARRGDQGAITLDFPALISRATSPPDDLVLGLGATPLSWQQGGDDLLIELDSETALRELTPDPIRLARWPVRGTVVTAPSDDPKFDFVCRCFYPALGIPEDPVTGSALCALTPWWAARSGRTSLVARQLSRRSGIVACELRQDRVQLTGRAVTTLRGTLAG